MSNINVSDYVVSDSGSVDVEATVSNFRAALESHLVERETEEATILDAIQAVFASHPGEAIKMPALVGFTLTELNVQAENYSTLEKRVVSVIRANNQGDSSLLVTTRGAGGGTRLRADISAAS